MGMCSNVKKSPPKEVENQDNQRNDKNKNNTEKPNNNKSDKNLISVIPLEDEFKDMEEWEGIIENLINFY